MSDILQRADGYEIDSDFVTDKSETPNVYADPANTAVTYTEDMQTAKSGAKFDIKTDVERSQEEWEQKYGGMQDEQERLSRDNAGKTTEDILAEIQGRQENGSDTEQKLEKQESDDRRADRSYTDEDAEFYARREENDHSAEVITSYNDNDGKIVYKYYSNLELYEAAVANGTDTGMAYVVDSDTSDAVMEKWQSEEKPFDVSDYFKETIGTATPYNMYKTEQAQNEAGESSQEDTESENTESQQSVTKSETVHYVKDKSRDSVSGSIIDGTVYVAQCNGSTAESSYSKFDDYLATHPDTENTTENENDMELGS